MRCASKRSFDPYRMRLKVRSGSDVVVLECDAYAVFDDEAMMLIVSDHTLVEENETKGFEIVWVV